MNEKKSKKAVMKKPSVKLISSAMQLKNGSFSLAVTAVVLAMIVLVNLIIGQLPSGLLNPDLSETGIFSISDTTKEYLDTLDKDITVEVVAESGSIDSRIRKFLDIYGDLSSRVNVSYVDPVLHPEILTKHAITSNSVVVSCADTDKKQIIPFSDIIVSEMNYYYSTESAFDAEGQLTGAVCAVASDNDKKLYLLRGHGEEALGSSVGELLTKNSMKTANLNLLEEVSVPEDCDLLIINNPTADLGTDEYTAVHNFLYQGGNVLLLRTVTDKQLKNLDALMEDYGMTMVNSYIGDRERYYQRAGSAFYFFPEITGNEINVDTSATILVGPVAGMTKAETMPEDVTLTTLLTTSDSAFREGNSNEAEQFLLAAAAVKKAAKETESETASENAGKSEAESQENTAEEAESTAKEDGTAGEAESTVKEDGTAGEAESTAKEDITAEEQATLGASLTDISVSGKEPWLEDAKAESKLTVITASSMISSAITDGFSGIENLNEFVNIVSSFFEDVQNVSIPAKSLTVTYNTVTGAGFWNLLFIGVIPGLFIVCGLVVWIRRRKA